MRLLWARAAGFAWTAASSASSELAAGAAPPDPRPGPLQALEVDHALRRAGLLLQQGQDPEVRAARLAAAEALLAEAASLLEGASPARAGPSSLVEAGGASAQQGSAQPEAPVRVQVGADGSAARTQLSALSLAGSDLDTRRVPKAQEVAVAEAQRRADRQIQQAIAEEDGLLLAARWPDGARHEDKKPPECEGAAETVLPLQLLQRLVSSCPEENHVALVRAWAQELGGDVSADELAPAQKLKQLALAQKQASAPEGEPRVLSGVLGLNFARRGAQKLARPRAFAQLARDYRVYKMVQKMDSPQITQMLDASDADAATAQVDRTIGSYWAGRRSLEQRRSLLEGGQKRSALLLTSKLGGTQRSASEAVRKYLDGAGYDAQVIDTAHDEEFVSGSWAQRLGNELYTDVVLKHHWEKLFSLVDRMNRYLTGPQHPRCPPPDCDYPFKDRTRNAMLLHRPDIVLSTNHKDLLPTVESALEVGALPVLHVATDADTKMGEVFDQRPAYPRLRVAVPYDLPAVYASIPPLTMDQVTLSGYPVRPAFLAPRQANASAAAKRARFPEGLLCAVLDGSAPWPSMLADEGIGQRLHVVAVAGADPRIAQKLGALRQAEGPGGRTLLQGRDPSVTLEVARTSEPPALLEREDLDSETMQYVLSGAELAALLDMADVVVTKPRGASTAEVTYRGVPAVIDATNGLLSGEEANVQALEDSHRGVRLSDATPAALRQALQDALQLGRSTASAAAEPGQKKKLLDPKVRLVAAIDEMLQHPCAPPCEVWPDAPPAGLAAGPLALGR